jgi:hypothetical protein
VRSSLVGCLGLRLWAANGRRLPHSRSNNTGDVRVDVIPDNPRDIPANTGRNTGSDNSLSSNSWLGEDASARGDACHDNAVSAHPWMGEDTRSGANSNVGRHHASADDTVAGRSIADADLGRHHTSADDAVAGRSIADADLDRHHASAHDTMSVRRSAIANPDVYRDHACADNSVTTQNWYAAIINISVPALGRADPDTFDSVRCAHAHSVDSFRCPYSDTGHP